MALWARADGGDGLAPPPPPPPPTLGVRYAARMDNAELLQAI
jgi:hypothetical protein